MEHDKNSGVWRWFVSSWCVPILLMGLTIWDERVEHISPSLRFLIPLIGVFGFAMAAVPYMRGQISLAKVSLMGIVFPFLIWIVLVILKIMALDS